MSGFWSFREPTNAMAPLGVSGLQESVSAQVLPYGREIAMEAQSSALAAYPWVSTDDRVATPTSTTNEDEFGADMGKVTFFQQLHTGMSAQVTPWKDQPAQTSYFSPHTGERPDFCTEGPIDDNDEEEDITVIEMNADDDRDDEYRSVPAAAAGVAARRLPFDTHCVSDLAVDETQTTWWQRTTTQPASTDAATTPETHPQPLSVAGEGVQALRDAVKPTAAQCVADDADRATLDHMLAPHRAAPAPRRRSTSAAPAAPRAQKAGSARSASQQHRDVQPTPDVENDEASAAVVGRVQPLTARRSPSARQPHRDPPDEARAASGRGGGGGLTFVARMEQRAAERRRAHEERKKQQEAHEASLVAQRVDQSHHVVEQHKSADGRPAFTLFGMRCAMTTVGTTAATSQRTARAPPDTSARRRGSEEPARSARTASARAPSSGRSRSRQPAKAACRTRVTPLDETTTATATSSTPSKTPRRVRFATHDGSTEAHHTAATQAAVSHPACEEEEAMQTVAAEAGTRVAEPIPFKEVAGLMLDDLHLALVHGDVDTAEAVERELSLLATDFHALRLTHVALRHWRTRGCARHTRAGPGAVVTAVAPVNAGFPACPFSLAYHTLIDEEHAHRQALVAEEAQASASLLYRAHHLTTALGTLLSRTRDRQMQTLRWCFVAWVSLEETHRTERLARQYREHLMACARQTLASLGASTSY